MNNPKILMFAPYGLWNVHHQVDAVLGAALRQRGAQVWAVGCDGIFERCPIGGSPSDENRCKACIRGARQIFEPFGVPVVWVGSVLRTEDVTQCRDWSQSVPVAELPDAEFEGGLLGRWVSAGVTSRFTSARLDLADPAVVATLRAYVFNAALLQRAFSGLLERLAPNHLVCYSGMHAYYRVAFELARRRGIPVLVHERGTIDDTFQFLPDSTTQMFEGRIKAWQGWQDVPLVRSELEWVADYMRGREVGKNLNWHSAYSYSSDAGEVHRALRLPREKPLVAVFPSNDWEYGMLRQDVPLAVDSQIQGFRALFESLPPDRASMVIRLHPPMGYSALSYGTDFLREILALNRSLPENVRLIMPGEKITSYALLWNASAAVTFGSTMGLEAFFKGIRALSFARNIYSPAVPWVSSLAGLPQALEEIMDSREPLGLEELRRAFRAAFYIFRRLNFGFKSFGIRDFHHFDLRIRSLADLSPGADPNLDRLVRHILERQPLPVPPGTEERERTDAEETAFIRKELAGIRDNRTRTALASRQAVSARPAPLVSALRIRRNGIRDPHDTVRHRSLTRSRHSDLELLPQFELSWPASASGEDFLRELRAGLDRAKGAYVHFAPDNLQVDEAFFSTAVDFLESDGSSSIDGLLAGAWICDESERPVAEIFTPDRPCATFEQAVEILPSLAEPSGLIALMVCRREAWQRLVETLEGGASRSLDLARAVFREAMEPGGILRIHRCGMPLICVHPQEDPAVLMTQGIDYGRGGRWERALACFESAWQPGRPSGEQLGFYRAAARARLGRLWEARIVAEAERVEARDSQALDQLIAELSRATGGGKPQYEDVSASVQTVEGWLVDGQERYLFEKAAALPENATILEIGSCFGRSTIAMAYACWGSGRHVYAVDTFIGNIDGGTRRKGNSFFDVWERNVASRGLNRHVTALPGFSIERLADWGEKPLLDFVFIDGSHHYVDIIRELELVYPLVKEGGWIAFHDVEPAWPGPWRVWHQSAAPLLASHESCGTIACGRKMAGRIFAAPGPGTGFDYAVQWVEFLRPRLPELAAALDQSLLLRRGAVDPEKIERAEEVIARMPDHPMVRRSLREMLKLEAQEDGFLNYWNALTLRREDRKADAAEAFEKALRTTPPAWDLHARLASHLGRESGLAPRGIDASEPVRPEKTESLKVEDSSGDFAAGKSPQPAGTASANGPEGAPLVVFVNTYYPGFVESVYRRNPHLRTATYADQLDALVHQCFGDSDFYSHGMRQAGWRAEDLIVNCLPLQQAWARENGIAGHGLEIAIEQIHRLKPQVVYIQDLSLATAGFLGRLRPLTELLVGQIASPMPPQAAPRGLDLVFSSFPHFVERFRAAGITAYYQPLAFEPRVLERIETEGGGLPSLQVTFVGGISAAHGKGLDFLERLAGLVEVDFWGYGAETLSEGSSLRRRHHGEAWGLDMFRLLRRSRITINRHIDVAENHANNMRMFEATGCGAMLITDRKDNLGDLFEVGKEVVAYDGAEECADLIRHFRAHPEQAEAIARAGQKRTLKDHTYAARMRQTAEILERSLRYRREAGRFAEFATGPVSAGYRAIAPGQISTRLTSAWMSPLIPSRQRALVQNELSAMYAGNAPAVYRAMVEALRPILKAGGSLLEIGCASGYYYEVIEYLLNRRVGYTGVDYSPPLIEMARDFYPHVEFCVADGAHLPFADRRFDVAVSSCVLLHVPNYREHIIEAARVARRYVVAHRTPICRQRSTQYLEKRAYGVETVELRFNESELMDAFTNAGLKPIRAMEYLSDDKGDSYEVTYIFEKWPGKGSRTLVAPTDPRMMADQGRKQLEMPDTPHSRTGTRAAGGRYASPADSLPVEARETPGSLMQMLESGRPDPNHPVFQGVLADPAKIGLTPGELRGKSDAQRREIIAGEYLARLSGLAGKAASALLFKAQWTYETPDWFDHRHHFLDPEKHCNDYWTASADNILRSLPLNGTLLDLCAGDGFYDYHFYRKRARRVVCVDINRDCHLQAMRLHRADNLVHLLQDVLSYEPDENTYDVVAIRGAIEHFGRGDQVAIFNKALKALKPGGWFCGDTVAGADNDSKMLPAHENEWADEAMMRRELEGVFGAVETFTLVSKDRTTLIWRCRKENPACGNGDGPRPGPGGN